MSKGSSRRPEAKPGTYEREYERIFFQPNAETIAAMEDARRGELEPFAIESAIADSDDDVSSGPSET